MEKCLSGRKSAIANRMYVLRTVGSNPTFSDRLLKINLFINERIYYPKIIRKDYLPKQLFFRTHESLPQIKN